MASSKRFLYYILDQLSGLEAVTYRGMMGEYILYYRGKVAAYICDDRLLVKPVRSAISLLPTAPHEPPYAGAREMLVVEDLEDRAFLERLFREMYDELPAPKQKK